MSIVMETLEKNRTWGIVELSKGKNLVGCKWVFTVKYKLDGSIEMYKVRLVAKGYNQTYGVDYLKTFAPITKMKTIKVLLSLVINFEWSLKQFMLRIASYMVILKRRFIWKFLLDLTKMWKTEKPISSRRPFMA